MKHLNAALAAGLIACAPIAANAEGVALVIGNADYAEAPDAATAFNDSRRIARLLGEAGFEVLKGDDLNRAEFASLLERFAPKAAADGPLVIYYSGHALRADGVTYLAPVDLAPSSVVDVMLDAIPLDLVLKIAGAQAGRAVVFLDAAQYEGFEPSAIAEPGIADPGEVDGVLLVSPVAPGRAIKREGKQHSKFAKRVAEDFLDPGAMVRWAVDTAGDKVWVAGDADDPLVLVAEPDPAAVDIAKQIEVAFWQSAEASKKPADYQAYLSRYPEGEFANLARNKLGQAEVKADPAAEAEKALKLTRSERRWVQEALTLLGHDPNGIDGIFGPGTRAGMESWQEANGHKPTGYLTEGQFARLGKQGEKAKRELAERLEREDRQYWQETGRLGTPAGYRAYLAKYPEGVNADKALAGLERLMAKSEKAEEKVERAAFRKAKAQGTVGAYQNFLDRYPDGNFAAAAKRELKKLDFQANFKRNAAIEKNLGLDLQSRISLEQRLAYLGFNPGPQDGAFDKSTRTALRDYQSDRGLVRTGFFNRDTVALVVEETSRRPSAGNVLQNLIGTITR
ncbi:MAG: peptidoglycan-binding protein [Pseudomonadota bacterium]